MRRNTILSAGLVLAGAIVLVECGVPERIVSNGAFGGRAIEHVPIAEVTSYASTLRFDAAGGDADVAAITPANGETIRLEAEPVVDASRISERDRAAGRIIARLTSSAAYAPLGLVAGVNYFWVDGKGDQARAVMIPADGSTRSVRPLMLRQHAYGNVMRPTARFVSAQGVMPGIPLVNARCGGYCCGFVAPGLSDKEMAALDLALLEMHRRIAAGL